MNLPPVPSGPIPPPPPVPSAGLPPPPPAPDNARTPLSRRVKLGFGLGAFALVAFAVLAGLLAPPTDEGVRAFVSKQLAREGIDVDGCFITNKTTEPKRISMRVNVTGSRRAGTGYVEVGGDPQGINGIPGGVAGGVAGPSADAETSFDFSEWRRIRELLSGKNGPRLLALAGLGADAESLGNVTLVREVTMRFSPVQLNASVVAERRLFKWNLSLQDSNLLALASVERTRPLSAFPGKVYVVNRPADREPIAALSRRLPEIRERLDQAVAALLQENKAAWLALLRPQALFAGDAAAHSYMDRTQKARVYLEITEVRGDEDPPRLSALLRNDGGWKETRVFSGMVAYDAGAGAFQLKLSSPASKGEEGAGPFLDDHTDGFNLELDSDGDSVLPLGIADGALTWKSGGATLRLEPVRAEARAALIAEAEGDYPKLLEATKAGMVYTGTITNRAKGTRESWLLRFTGQEEKEGDNASGADMHAILEHPERLAWKCALRGHLEANRYRAKGTPLGFDQEHHADFAPPHEVTDMFETRNENAAEPGSPIGLRLDGAKLVGENSRFVFRFERATPELLAEREKREAARVARLLAFVQPGAVHDGTVEGLGLAPARVRLRFVQAEDRGARVEVHLHGPQRPELAQRLRGRLDASRGVLQLTFEGPANPQGNRLDSDPELKAYFSGRFLGAAEWLFAVENETMAGRWGPFRLVFPLAK